MLSLAAAADSGRRSRSYCSSAHRWTIYVCFLLLLASCGQEQPITTLSDEQAVSIRLRETIVRSGDSIYAEFAPRKGSETEIRLSPALALSIGQQHVNRLLVRDVGGINVYPAQLSPSDPVPTLALIARTGKFYRYELPKLEPGQYKVCESYRFAQKEGKVCALLTVE